MRPPAEHRAPVAIVGAGPVGLSLALGLARHGVRSVVLERKAATSDRSKAPGIHVRTREIFRQWGVEDRIVEAGELRREMRIHSASSGRSLLRLDFRALDAEADRAGILVLEQGRTEALLLGAVRETGMCEVRFGAEAIALDADPAGARLTVRGRGGDDGAVWALDAQYVVGCDGAGSFVRDALGLRFDGTTYSLRPMLADVRIVDARDALPWPRLHNGADGLTVGIRLESGVWRIIRIDRAGREGAGAGAGAGGGEERADAVPDGEVRARAAEVLGEGAADVVWASRFRIHRRSAARFRVGRVMLAGDAAHIHSPLGAQGMNAGIQDAHNLAWKLAAALAGGDADTILDSYDAERRAVVVGSVSRFTDVLTRAFLQTPRPVRVAALLAVRLALAVPGMERRALRRVAMLDLHYPGGEDRAGERLPNPVLHAVDGGAIRLYDALAPGPALIVVGDAAPPEALLDDVDADAVIRVGPGGYTDPAGVLPGLLEGGRGWILARPDAHIAATGTA